MASIARHAKLLSLHQSTCISCAHYGPIGEARLPLQERSKPRRYHQTLDTSSFDSPFSPTDRESCTYSSSYPTQAMPIIWLITRWLDSRRVRREERHRLEAATQKQARQLIYTQDHIVPVITKHDDRNKGKSVTVPQVQDSSGRMPSNDSTTQLISKTSKAKDKSQEKGKGKGKERST